MNLAGQSSELDGFLADAGFTNPETRELPIPGWSLFAVSEASSTQPLTLDAQIAADIATLLEEDEQEVYFFAPVFEGRFGPIIPTDSILVVFEDDVTAAEVTTALAAVDLDSAPRSAMTGNWNAYRIQEVSRSGITVLERANALAQRPEVLSVEPNMLFQGRSASGPNDPFYPASWNLHNTGQTGGTPDIDIDAPEAWERTMGDSQVITAIFDTGVDQYHQDLRQLPGLDVTGDNGGGGPINVCDNHGTPVAGVHFASAGNDSVLFVEFPASLSSVYAVSAIESSGNRAAFSNWGAEIAFTGPGQNLYSTDRTGTLGWSGSDYVSELWGTSFSSPMIAGIAALLLSEAYSLDADEVEALLKASVQDLGTAGWDQFYGWGLPKARTALDALDLFSDDFETGNTSRWSAAKP